MTKSLTVTLPEEITDALDALAKREGMATDEVVGRAIREHVLLRRFRLLRERMSAHAQTQGILTDEDVFDRVS